MTGTDVAPTPDPPGIDPRTPPVLGREVEIARIDAYLARADARPLALVIEGEAGIGKSTLWHLAVDRARAVGRTVLVARPVEAETGQSYAAIADLVSPIASDALHGLPEPQRRALAEVLLLEPASGDRPVDPRAVGAAVSGAIRSAASTAPVVIAIDDVTWLDRASARVVSGVVRRLEDLPVAIVVTQRSSVTAEDTLGLEGALGAERLVRIELGGLTRGGLQQLLHRRLGMTFARPILNRLHAASGGNPYVALEIARAIGRRPRPLRLDEPLPVPASIRALVRDRLAGLDPDLGLALLSIAASATSTLPEVAGVIGDRSRAETALATAEQLGLVVIDRHHYRSSHPLLGSTVYADADAARLRFVHARLAEVAGDPEARARHLARSVVAPDEAVAATLEAAAADARRRGAPEAAAELLRMALELTPGDGGGRARRRVLLGTALLEIGSTSAAILELDLALATLPPGKERAAAGLQRAIAAWYGPPDLAAERIAGQALADADVAGDASLAARIEAYRAVFCVDMHRATSNATAAVERADRAGAAVEPSVRALAIWQRFLGEIYLGHPPDGRLAELGRKVGPIHDPAEAPTVPGIWELAAGRIDEARGYFLELLARSEAVGAVTSVADLEARLAEVELQADAWDAALERVERAAAAAVELEQAVPPAALRVLAEVRARRGDVDGARRIVCEHLDPVRSGGDPRLAAAWLQTATSVERIAGEMAAADRLASEATAALAGIGVVEPLLFDTAPDQAEARVSLGDRAGAAELLAGLERRMAVIPRTGHAAAIARIRALLASSDEEVASALEATAPALDADAGWGRYDRLRTLLARAALQRRRRDRRGASRSLEVALELADRLAARPWRRRVEEEQARLGRHRPGSTELTPTEVRVAEEIAAGRTNREVASRLFMSPKTVEAHLSSIYGKLGIASRAELGRMMAARPTAPD